MTAPVRELLDAFMREGGTDEPTAIGMVAAVCKFFTLSVDDRLVAALDATAADAKTTPANTLLWLHATRCMAATANGGEFILKAAVTIAAQRGVSADLLAQLQAHGEH